jgi:MerR family transcriptional regulator/heat shock protein HspR
MEERRRPRYMISVAAELVGIHPQTLRIYEQKGLVHPQRTAGNTRLYSDADVERVLHMEDELQRMQRRLERMEDEMRRALDEVHRFYRRDLVLYQPAQPPARRN